MKSEVMLQQFLGFKISPAEVHAQHRATAFATRVCGVGTGYLHCLLWTRYSSSTSELVMGETTRRLRALLRS